MKKMYIILGMMMVLIASAVAASVSVTYNFRDIQAWQPLSNVDTLVYPCLDAGCNVLNLAMPLPGSGNSGSSSQTTITYPTSLMTPYGYAAYYFAHGFAPQEYLATWNGNGATTYNINFNKIANCKSDINNLNVVINPGVNNSVVRLRANVESAFSDPHNYVGYVLPQYAAEFYSSQIEVRFRIYDGNNALVFQDARNVNLYMDATTQLTSSRINLAPGTYRAEVETVVTDNQCSNSLPQVSSRTFTINGPLPECSDGIDNDLDSLIDFPLDPGCIDANDDNETNIILPPECSDGIDNDGDGFIDFPADLGCENATDDDETNPDVCGENLNISRAYMNGERRYEFMNYSLSSEEIARGYMDFDTFLTNTGDSEMLYTNYSINLFSTTNSTWGYGYTYFLSDIDPHSTILDSRDFNLTDIHDGRYEVFYLADSVDSNGCSYVDSFRFFLVVNTSQPHLPECSDSIDNDGDGLIDFPLDPGCINTTDDNETDIIIPPECSDSIDNDGDGLIDFPLDPGCINTTDDNETDVPGQNNAPFVTLLSPVNGMITNVNDIVFRYNVTDDTADILECTLYTDISGSFAGGISQFTLNSTEDHFIVINIPDGTYVWNIECDDGVNSAFALENWTFTINTTLPEVYECSDGIDNDFDGMIDFPNDPGCENATDDDETDFTCTNHLNISRVNLGAVEVFEGLTYPLNNNYLLWGYIPFDFYFTNTGSSTIWNVNYTTTMTNESGNSFSETGSIVRITPYMTLIEGQDLILPSTVPNGLYNISLDIEGVDSYGCFQDDEFGFSLLVNRSAPTYECSDSMDNDGDVFIDSADPGCYDTGSYNPFDNNETDTLPECSDYFDNDADNLTDFPNDPGCTDANDDNETDPVILPECSDGIDNDLDSLIDFPLDPGCVNATDDDETDPIILPECSDSIDNDGDGFIDFPADPGCISQFDNNETDGNQMNEAPFVVLMYPFNHMVTNDTDMPFMYIVFDDSALLLNCTLYTNISGTFQPEQSLMTLNGFFGIMGEQDIPDGTYIWNVECSDGQLSAFAPENWTFTINSIQSTLPECSDGIDNDGDGLIDYPNDPGCVNATDNDEGGHGSNGNNGNPIIIPEILDPEQILYIGHIDIHSTTSTGFEQELARAGDEVEISVYLENLASYTLENLKLSIYMDELAIWRTIGPFDLASGQHTTKHVYMDIPDDAKKGIYDVRIVAGNEDIKRVKYRIVKVIKA